MEVPHLTKISLVAGAIGVVSRLGFFIRGEHHKQSARYLAVFTIAPVLLFFALVRVTDSAPWSDVAKCTAAATFSYFTALITSILTYRGFFHSLM
jgi:hypothetical protein